MATAGLAHMDANANHRLDAYFAGLCESLVASLRTVFLEQLEAERDDMRHSFEAELNRVHSEYKDYIDHLQKPGSAPDRGNLPVEIISKPRLPPTPQSEQRRHGMTPQMPVRNVKPQEVLVDATNIIQRPQQAHNAQSQDLIVVEKLVLPSTRAAMQPTQQVVQAAQQVVQVLHQEAAHAGAHTHRAAVQPLQAVQQVQHVVQQAAPAPQPTPQTAPRTCNAFFPTAATSHIPPIAQWAQGGQRQPFFPFHAEPGGGKQQRQESGSTAPSHTDSHGTIPSTAPACNAQSPILNAQSPQSPPPPAPERPETNMDTVYRPAAMRHLQPPAPPEPTFEPPGTNYTLPATTQGGLHDIHDQASKGAVHQPNYGHGHLSTL